MFPQSKFSIENAKETFKSFMKKTFNSRLAFPFSTKLIKSQSKGNFSLTRKTLKHFK
jgi:hypothetical protein